MPGTMVNQVFSKGKFLRVWSLNRRRKPRGHQFRGWKGMGLTRAPIVLYVDMCTRRQAVGDNIKGIQQQLSHTPVSLD